MLDAPPPHPQFHVKESVTHIYWNNFAGMVLPRMLAENPGDGKTRSLCAELALAFNFTVIQDLMTAAFEHREVLGDDFLRLQHIVLVSSGMRNVVKVANGGNSIWRCLDIKPDIEVLYAKLIDRFVQSATPTDLPSLVDIAEEATSTIAKLVGQQHKMSYRKPMTDELKESITKRVKRGRGFEPLHLRAGFNWLEKIEIVKDAAERERWIGTIENVIHGFLRPLGGIEEALFDDHDDSTFFAFPGDWDNWVFDLTASVIPKLEESESAHRLWEPILSFGLERIHWVNAFLSAWFIRGLAVEGREEHFFREWKQMIAYAWTRELAKNGGEEP